MRHEICTVGAVGSARPWSVAAKSGISVGGAAVTFPPGALPSQGLVQLQLPGAAPLKMEMVTTRERGTNHELASLKLADDDWNGYRTMSLWLFHTPPNIPQLAPGLPAIATTRRA